MDNDSRKNISVLIRCCLCAGGALGIVNNCIGIYFSPISQALGVPVGRMSIIITLLSLATAFFAPVFVRLVRRFPIRFIMTFGVLLDICSFVIMSFAPNIWVLYAAGVTMGVGCCCFSSLPVTMILREWYGDKIGSVTGIVMAFGGLFGALLNPVFSRLITSMGWNMSLRIQAVILMAIVLPCAMTLRMNPKKVIQTVPRKVSGMPGKKESVSPKVLLALILVAVSFSAQNGINTHLSALGVSRGFTLEFSSVMLSAVYVANVSFKLIHGWIADRTSPYVSTILCCSIALSGALILLLFASTPFMMIAGAFLYGSCFSCSTVGTSLLTQRAAGDDYAKVYSRITMFASTSYALATSVYGLIRDAAGSYTPSLALVCVFSCCALFMIMMLYRTEKHA